MPKFFVNKADVQDDTILLKGENAKHIQVLRHNIDDSITVCDSQGMDFQCLIKSISRDSVTLEVLDSKPCVNEPDMKVTLFQALPKSTKMDLIIQKCVELGIYEIVPVITEHAIVKKVEPAKIQRYNKISEAAAKQCLRGIIPRVTAPLSFKDAVARMTEMEQAFFLYENAPVENKKILTENTAKHIGIFVGPEGGFSGAEAEYCMEKGLKTVSLGNRILRTETAGFTALIILLFCNSDS